ncbi:MAG: hypothetical protein JXA41_08955 [Deltaproteobacteria bacterium]|nr:hypothetical protein [Deltaproteobacteria bacterium]
MIMAVMVLFMPEKALAEPSVAADSSETKKPALWNKEVVPVEQEPVMRFYEALERLMDHYGEDHNHWPDNEDRRLIERFLNRKDALTLNNCIFGRNFLGLGIGETAEDAAKALREGAKDAWGRPYSLILAGSKDAPKPVEILYAIGANRGVSLFNRDICTKVFVFLKADLHSLFADIFKNFNGMSILLMAREVHILGAPGSVEPGYEEKLKPALCAADSLYGTVYIGENDPVTEVIPMSFREKMHALFGMTIPKFKGTERKSDECRDKVPPPVEMFRLKGCGHLIPEYQPWIRKYGKTMLKKRETQ